MLTYTKWPVVENKHREAIASVVDSGAWHYGNVYRRLEDRLSEWLGRRVLTSSSCAWSIFLGLRALSITGKVAVPAYGYHGTVHPVMWAGAEPIFVDCSPKTFNICPASLQSTLSNNQVSAVIGVHIHGMPFDHDIVTICTQFGIPLIEDVCQAQGARLKGQLTGTFGTFAAFSFNSRKMLPAGLGGSLASSSKALLDRIESLRNYGAKDIDDSPIENGYYFPISEFDAALTMVQLDSIDTWIDRANKLAMIIQGAIPARFPFKPADRTHTWHKLRIRGTEDERLRIEHLGIVTSRWVPKPLTDYLCYKAFSTKAQFPGAAEICKDSFCIFNDDYPLMAQSDETVCQIGKILGETLHD
jgi:dTDP-4-amino-4,6-dideoxygalactose transaminase